MAIRAFVGHSFRDEDSDVVDVFLELLERISSMGIDFSWEHAEWAEAKELSTKVKEKMEDKNTFVGICTAREMAIGPESLVPLPILHNRLISHASKYTTKTSDWLLQEIGFAFGRNMRIVILLEKGLRAPGGLQGDIEYIAFDRSRPELSYPKLLEMIQSLIPKVVEDGQEAPASKTTKEGPQDQDSPAEGEEEKPREEWTFDDFDRSLLVAIFQGDSEAESDVFDAYLESELPETAEDEPSWRARRFYYQLQYQNKDVLDELIELRNRHPKNPQILHFTAVAYEKYSDYLTSAKLLEESAQVTEEPGIQFHRHRLAAINFAKANNPAAQSRCLELAQSLEEKVDSGRAHLLKAKAEIAKAKGDDQLSRLYLEGYLDKRPNDHSARFDLAYGYSENGDNDLAAVHYRILTNRKPGTGNWNNLGVALDALGIKSRCAIAYREAAALGNTLAMSNLAHKYINEGFLDDAENLTAEAVRLDDYDQSIGNAIGRIKKVKDDDAKAEDKIENSLQSPRRFFVEFADASVRDPIQQLPDRWTGPKCPLQVSIAGQVFRASGSYEVEEKGFNVAAILSGKKEDRHVIERVCYEGQMEGRSISYLMWTWREGTTPPTDKKPDSSGLFIVDDSAERIRGYAFDAANRDEFFELTAIHEAAPASEIGT